MSGGMGGHRDRDQPRQDLGPPGIHTEGLRHPPAPRPPHIGSHPLVIPLLPRFSPLLSPIMTALLPHIPLVPARLPHSAPTHPLLALTPVPPPHL